MRSFHVLIAAVVVLVSGFVAPARAGNELIEFQFSGVFTEVNGAPYPVGSPFTATLSFDPASVDLNPSPVVGSYRGAIFTVPGRLGNQIILEDAFINVSFGSAGSDTWRVDFVGGGSFNYNIVLGFPIGYFPTDALPLTLDFSQSTTRLFRGSDFNFSMQGTVTSLSVVPEPMTSAASFVAFVLGMRRRA
jgi:hypothetical protein